MREVGQAYFLSPFRGAVGSVGGPVPTITL